MKKTFFLAPTPSISVSSWFITRSPGHRVIAVASNLLAMASNLLAMASNLLPILHLSLESGSATFQYGLLSNSVLELELIPRRHSWIRIALSDHAELGSEKSASLLYFLVVPTNLSMKSQRSKQTVQTTRTMQKAAENFTSSTLSLESPAPPASPALEPRAVPTESSSSKKRTQGAAARALSKTSRTLACQLHISLHFLFER